MNEEENNAQEQIVPRPEGYTIVKYPPGWTYLVYYLSIMLLPLWEFVFKAFPHDALHNYIKDSYWLSLLPFFLYLGILWVIMRKVTEVKVNLKITEEGLEQTRLSGSKLYPKYRMIKWEEMKHYYPNGRIRGQEFQVSVKHGMNFRVSVPCPALFEKQKDNCDNLSSFIDVFWDLAPQHGVHRGFWV